MSKAQVERDYRQLRFRRVAKIIIGFERRNSFERLMDRLAPPAHYYPMPLLPIDDDYRK